MKLLEVHTHVIDRLAVANSIVSGVALYPQVFAIVRSSDLSGVSLTTFMVIFLNNIVWALYAFHRHLISLLVAAVLNMLAAGIVLLALLVQIA